MNLDDWAKAVIESGKAYGLVLAIMDHDDIMRIMITEEIGERAVKKSKEDAIADELMVHYDEVTWDDISRAAVAYMRDSPGGRGEV